MVYRTRDVYSKKEKSFRHNFVMDTAVNILHNPDRAEAVFSAQSKVLWFVSIQWPAGDHPIHLSLPRGVGNVVSSDHLLSF